MTGFKIKPLPMMDSAVLAPWFYGDVRGAHIRVVTVRSAPPCFVALYYGGARLGVLLGVQGSGRTNAEAVRDLWRKLHP